MDKNSEFPRNGISVIKLSFSCSASGGLQWAHGGVFLFGEYSLLNPGHGSLVKPMVLERLNRSPLLRISLSVVAALLLIDWNATSSLLLYRTNVG